MMPVGVVLAGGRSSRMGADKALVAIGGQPMVARVAAALRGAGCDPVWCQGGDAAALSTLGLKVHPDRSTSEHGPLPAIVEALRVTDRDPSTLVVISACDLPNLDTASVTDLLTVAAADPSADVIVAADSHGVHLLGVWRSRARAALEELIAGGQRSYRGAVAALDARLVPIESDRVRNVNTPGDAAIAQSDAVSSGQRLASAAMAIPEIDVDGLADALAAGARLIDVREPDEFVEARVPGAVLVPLASVPDNVEAFRGDGHAYVICKSGGRSMRACEFLAAAGVDVVNVEGGTLAWLASGRPYADGPA